MPGQLEQILVNVVVMESWLLRSLSDKAARQHDPRRGFGFRT